MIDAHHHFWNYTEKDFGWIDNSMSVIRKSFGPDKLFEASAGEVEGFVSVQARTDLAENRFLLDYANAHDRILGVVGWADLCSERAAENLDAYADEGKFVGVREIIQGESNDAFFNNAAFHSGVREVTKRDLAYDLLIFQDQLESTVSFVDQHAGQRIVIDHCAKPSIEANAAPPDVWARGIWEIAKRDNVWCKFSGLSTEIKTPATTCDAELLAPYMDILLDAFGPQRLMFGTDWPVALLGTNYSDWVASVRTLTEKLSADEQRAIHHQNAVDFYQLQRDAI